MKAWGVSISSERRQRGLSKELLGANLASEAALFSFPLEGCGEELRAAPLAYVPDLAAKICQLLDQNDRYKNYHSSDCIEVHNIAFLIHRGRSSHITQRCDPPWEDLDQAWRRQRGVINEDVLPDLQPLCSQLRQKYLHFCGIPGW